MNQKKKMQFCLREHEVKQTNKRIAKPKKPAMYSLRIYLCTLTGSTYCLKSSDVTFSLFIFMSVHMHANVKHL